MEQSVALVLSIASAFFGLHTNVIPQFTSVELGITELSPLGETGGYAMPASGGSMPSCSLSVNDPSITVGDDTTIIYSAPAAEDQWTVDRCDEFGGNCVQIYSHGGGDYTQSALASGLAAGVYQYQAHPRVVEQLYAGRSCTRGTDNSGDKVRHFTTCNDIYETHTHWGTCTANLTVTDGPPTCTITASPANVTLGDTVQLDYTISGNADSATVNQGVGAVPETSGSVDVTPGSVGTIAYTLTVANVSGSNDCTTNIVDVAPPPTADLVVCDLGGANCADSKNIVGAEEVELQWTSTNASSCLFSNFDGDDGDGDPSTGGDDATVTEPTPGNNTIYSINCDGATDSVVVSKGIGGDPDLTVDGSRTTRIVRTGTDVDVCWDVNGHDPLSCTFTGPVLNTLINPPASDCITINVQNTSTFELSCPGFPADSVLVRVIPIMEEN